MTIADVVSKAPDVVNAAGNTLLAVVIVATLIARIVGAKSKEQFLGEEAPKLIKILHWLPTVGINPRTAKLEEAYQDLLAQNSAPLVLDASVKTAS